MNPRSLTYEEERRYLRVKNLDGLARRRKHTWKHFHLPQAELCLTADPCTVGGEGAGSCGKDQFDLHEEGPDLKAHWEQG